MPLFTDGGKQIFAINKLSVSPDSIARTRSPIGKRLFFVDSTQALRHRDSSLRWPSTSSPFLSQHHLDSKTYKAWLKRSSFSGALMTRPYLDTLGKTLLESLGSESISLEIEEIGLVNLQSFKGSSGVSVDCTSKGYSLNGS
ncbi:hypothetical protein TNIN_419571 [Trichonephila inaurata madagascariensis]|uniref:Uncharacterized protein n=1 Tax=Trichonephila inaurata madagascariensis TaxID=2747483 RepID=A0A8X6Y8C0_9ARAC|nr:hypothetical protein TNIN_419571 [Trichonephila inaurata madagascariensis]